MKRKFVLENCSEYTDKNIDTLNECNESERFENENQEESEDDNCEKSNVDTKDGKIKLNPEWADAMAKILKTNKPKRKKTIVLAKAKKLKIKTTDEGEKKKVSFEIDGEIKSEEESNVKVENGSNSKISKRLGMANKIRKQALEAIGRVKPSILEKDREKVLAKVATKGVVQLFNAVRQQQKSIEKEIKKVGPSNAKQEKVLKSVDKKAFLNILMGAKSQSVPETKIKSDNEWSVLRDDFMMSSKLKDWDRDDDVFVQKTEEKSEGDDDDSS